MALDDFVSAGDVDRVRTRLRARFGAAVSDRVIDEVTVAAFAGYESAKVDKFVALLAERDATRRLTALIPAPVGRGIADMQSARARVAAERGLGEPAALGGAA
jgi:hypothetical protein